MTLKEISERKSAGKNFRMLFCDLFCSRWCMKDKYKARLAKVEDRIERELDIAQFIKR